MEKINIKEKELCCSLLYNAPNPIIVIGADTSIAYVNPAFEKITDYTSLEVIGKRPPYPWWTERTEWHDEKKYKKSFKEGIHNKEQVFRKKRGEQFWVEINMNVVEANNNIEYVVSNWLDITRRKKTENTLREIVSRLQKVTALASIAPGIIHEIKVPLDAINIRVKGMKFIYDMGKPIDNEKYIEDLKHLSYNMGRIEQIIQTMQKRISEKQEENKVEVCYVNEVVNHALVYLKHKLLTYDIEIELYLMEEKVLVQADFLKLEEVLINLILNAKEALEKVEKEKKKIEISTKIRGSLIILEVSDNGTGIDMKDLPCLFDPFYSTKKNGNNLGLGLYLVQETITEFQGEINVSNNNIGGTTVCIELRKAQ